MSTLETLQNILMGEFALERQRITPTATLTELGIDSLDLLELMFKIEDSYQLSIRDDIPATLSTVGELVAFIDQLLAQRVPLPVADLPAPT